MKYLHYFNSEQELNTALDTKYQEPWIGVVDKDSTDDLNIKTYNRYNIYKDNIEYVDLGLPSGTLWMTKNLGAQQIYIDKDSTVLGWNEGIYLPWGELEHKETSNWTNYKFGGKEQSNVSDGLDDGFTKYGLADNKVILEPEDDIITQTFGGLWCIPTADDFSELINSTNTTWACSYVNNTTYNKKVYTITFTSKTNGNTLTFSGIDHSDDKYVMDYFRLWSSTSATGYSTSNNKYIYSTSKASFLHIAEFSSRDEIWISTAFKYNQYNIRGVIHPKYSKLTIPE